MAYTDKQIRNGATGDAGVQDSAQPGPIPDVAPIQSQAQSAGLGNMQEGHALTGEIAGHAVSFVWDSGLAVNDFEGGGSG